jgi:hypothetical protein
MKINQYNSAPPTQTIRLQMNAPANHKIQIKNQTTFKNVGMLTPNTRTGPQSIPTRPSLSNAHSNQANEFHQPNIETPSSSAVQFKRQ